MRDQTNRRILIIDDNRAIHEDFRKILAAKDSPESAYGELSARIFGENTEEQCTCLGFELDSAFQGQEGLEKVKQRARRRQTLWRRFRRCPYAAWLGRS